MDRSDTAALPARAAAPATAERPRPGAAFLAQALGQGGARRGLKGGAPLLARARHAYLSTEWSGEDDRRPSPGLLRRHDV